MDGLTYRYITASHCIDNKNKVKIQTYYCLILYYYYIILYYYCQQFISDTWWKHCRAEIVDWDPMQRFTTSVNRKHVMLRAPSKIILYVLKISCKIADWHLCCVLNVLYQPSYRCKVQHVKGGTQEHLPFQQWWRFSKSPVQFWSTSIVHYSFHICWLVISVFIFLSIDSVIKN